MRKGILLVGVFWAFLAQADQACDNQDVCVFNCAKTANDDCTATFDKDTGTLTISGKGEMADYSYVWENGNMVAISMPWYDYRNEISALKVEEGITGVGDFAFNGYTILTNVELPNGLARIGRETFSSNPSLQTIDIPDSVTEIASRAFADCSQIHELTLPQSLTTVGDGAFMNTGIVNLVFPESVVSISPEAFYADYDYWKTSQILNLYCNKVVEEQCETALQWKKDLGENVNVISYQRTPDGQVFYDNKWYNNANDILSGNYIKKRIYTIDEANRVTGDKNRVSIKYR